MSFVKPPDPSPVGFRKRPTKGPFAKLFTKRTGRNKKKSLLRILRSDFLLSGLRMLGPASSSVPKRLFLRLAEISRAPS
jgi:hypothetical protein